MAHFAKLSDNNEVLSVHVVNNDVLLNNGVESEQKGIDFLTELHGYSNWKQTSYSSSFRKNFAGVGFIYDEIKNAFYEPSPYPSWILNEDTCKWEPPVPMPNDGSYQLWDEKNQTWITALTMEEMKELLAQIVKEQVNGH